MKNKLPLLTDCQKNRLEEVRFYLIFSKLNEFISKNPALIKSQVMATIFEMLKVEQVKILNAYAVLNSDLNKPSILDKTVTLAYIEYPTRESNSTFVTVRKYNDALRLFINTPTTIRSGYFNSLLEKNYSDLLEEIKQFNKNAKELEPIFKLAK